MPKKRIKDLARGDVVMLEGGTGTIISVKPFPAIDHVHGKAFEVRWTDDEGTVGVGIHGGKDVVEVKL